MTLELLEAVQNNKLRVAELRKYSRAHLTAPIETSFGPTTLLHQLMLIGSEALVRTALEIVGADRPGFYMALDADHNTPLHAFAQRVGGGASAEALTAAVIAAAPIEALRAKNKEGNTPVHLFPLCGNLGAVELCRRRDASLVALQNAYRQTPAELALEAQRMEMETQLKTLRADNRRLTHNQSMADAEEAKLAEFYQRMDIELKRRDAEEAKLRAAVDESNARIKAMEAIAQTKERVMREAIAKREEAERAAADMTKRWRQAGDSQSAALAAADRTRLELEERAARLEEQSAALNEAYGEITALRADTEKSLAEDQRKKIADAEARAAKLEAQFAAEQEQRDRVASELAAQQTLVTQLRDELERARQRVTEVETRKTSAERDESAARARFDEQRAQLSRAQADERAAFEKQIATLREQNDASRSELSRLQLSGDEAKKLRETLDAERDRTEQWRQAHEESEARVRTLMAELEAEQARPITPQTAAASLSSSSSSALQRRPSSTKMSAAVAAALHASIASGVAPSSALSMITTTASPSSSSSAAATDEPGSPRSRCAAPAPVVEEDPNDRFLNNVINRVLECDYDTLALLVSAKLEFDVASLVDRTGTCVLELFLNKVLQSHYVATAAGAAGKNEAQSAQTQQYVRAPEMFELLVRAGARWDGLPNFIAEHGPRLWRTLTAKFDVYEQWWPFADALLAGDKVKDAHVAIGRTLASAGNPNHVLTQFHSKAHRDAFVGRQMTYLHLALELYNEQVLAVVELLLTMPGIDVNLANSHQMTPLHAAINRFHKLSPVRCAALVEALMAAGGDPLRPCDNAEVIEHWATLAAENVSKHATSDYEKERRRDALETASRAKTLQRSRTTKSLIGTQREASKYGNDEMTWLVATTRRYTTPHAMAGIVNNERLLELVTQARYRRVETRALAELVVERALLHHWLVESFETGGLARYPQLAKHFEFLHHVLHAFNPYTTSVIVATGVRPRVLKVKIAVGLAQSLVDVDERHIVELISRRLDDPNSVEAKALTAGTPSPSGTLRTRFGNLADVKASLEQIVADLEGTDELVVVAELASALLRVANMSESHTFDVSAPILASVLERYDESVEQAIVAMIERTRTPPAAFVYVVARDDAQFGPHVCYDTMLSAFGQTVLQALVARGDVEKLEALFERAPEALEHRLASDRALAKLAVDTRQPLVLAWFDFIAERSATARRRMFEGRTVGTDGLAGQAAALRRAKVERDAKQCKAPHREHYSLVTVEGDTILHLAVMARRPDLLDFVLTTVFPALQKCDARARRPIELATQLALVDDKSPLARREALTRCAVLLRGQAHLAVSALTLPPLPAQSPRRGTPPTPVATAVPTQSLSSSASSPPSSNRENKVVSPRRKHAHDDPPADPDKGETALDDALKSPRSGESTEEPTPRRHRHRHRSSCINKDK